MAAFFSFQKVSPIFFLKFQCLLCGVSMDLLPLFENELLKLEKSGIELKNTAILAGVSGGADSMVMLSLLKDSFEKLGFSFSVVTVNHNIRPEKETLGDAEFVKNFCDKNGISCRICGIEKGKVFATAEKRGKGIEEAARFLRYEIFENTAGELKADLVFLAHNKNDFLETVLQRFIQGAGVCASSGIKQKRGIFFRPLLNVKRAEIEEYAAEKCIPFRTDSTNFDNDYLRNKIRNKLIPFLSELEPGWESAVVNGAYRHEKEAEVIKKLASKVVWHKTGDCAETDASVFEKHFSAVKTEALYNGLRLLGTESRIPGKLLYEFAETMTRVSVNGIVIEKKGEKIRLFYEKQYESSGFYVIINQPGRYKTPFGEIDIKPHKDGLFFAEESVLKKKSGFFRLPVVVRCRSLSDYIKTADGNRKEVSKIFSEWHIPEETRNSIPLFEDSELRGIWGSLYGFNDWFVKY